ncbi:MAG: HlyD family secretion protein [Bacteroidales bacterium]|jgi:membrane fusion protein (multidrug efflux system)
MAQNSKKKKLNVYIPLGIVIVAVLAGAFIWYKDYMKYVTTDDAKVDADNITVSSKILGRIVTVYAQEGDVVRQGELLAELDSSDLVAQRNQALALKAQALANLSQADAKYASDQQGLKVVEINFEKAREDLDRAKKQSEGGVITEEQYDHITKAYEAASAQVDASKALIEVSKSQIASASASVQTADAQTRVLDTQLRNTKLWSPGNGIIARRWLMPGDVIQPGQSVFTFTNDNKEWIVCYLEETKIEGVQDGQSAKFTIDAFKHVKFYGKVFLTGTSTAATFSLIPANNASGNFTKVTQRIPLRISIDSASNGKAISSFNILPGMSAVVKITRKR